MKDLQALERELALIEEDLRKIEARVGRVSMELGQLREAEIPAGIDFEAVRRCAELYPRWRHPLSGTKGKELYPTAVLSLMKWRAGTDFHLLVFGQWLLKQTGSRKRLEDCLAASYQVTPEMYGKLKRQILGDLRLVFLMDLLIGSSLSGPASSGALEYISELAALLKIGVDELRVLALAARVVLRQSVEGMERVELLFLSSLPQECRFYLTENIWEMVKNGLRCFVMSETVDSRHISWKKGQGDTVRQGETVAKIKSRRYSQSAREVTAVCPGYFYHFSHKGIVYGVVAGPGDSKESIKDWVANAGKVEAT